MDLLAGWYQVLFILVSNSSYVFWLFRAVKSVSWHRNDNQYPSHYDVVTLLSLIDVHFDHMEVFRRS